MTEREEIDMLAAEYVIGTLDAAMRAEIAARRQREPDLDNAISAWEATLSPMLDDVAEQTPPQGLFAEIEQRIADGTTSASVDFTALQRRLSRWRWATAGSMALAAGLAIFILTGGDLKSPSDQQFVAVFQQDDRQPAFVLSIDLQTRELTIRPITADQPSDKTYQLWIASDQIGEGPQSLGLIDSAQAPTRKRLQQFDPQLLRRATFGISLEPAGGSPTGKPTGPAIHGTLIPAKP